jgi:AcrR family transcriptional regulator
MNKELSDRQKEIIEVSLDLISEGGIQGLTIKNLAKRIGFSESAIYRHYENKIDILTAILDHFKSNTEDFYNREFNSNLDTLSKIEHLFKNQFRMFAASPSLVAVIFAEELFRNEISLKQKVAEIMQNTSKILARIILEGQQQGSVRRNIDASHLAIIVLGSLRMYVKQWHISDYSFNLVKEGEAFILSIKEIIKS